MSLGVSSVRGCGEGFHDTEYNDIQHNDTQHDNKNLTLSITVFYAIVKCHYASTHFHCYAARMLSVVLLNVVMLNVIMGEACQPQTLQFIRPICNLRR